MAGKVGRGMLKSVAQSLSRHAAVTRGSTKPRKQEGTGEVEGGGERKVGRWRAGRRERGGLGVHREAGGAMYLEAAPIQRGSASERRAKAEATLCLRGQDKKRRGRERERQRGGKREGERGGRCACRGPVAGSKALQHYLTWTRPATLTRPRQVTVKPRQQNGEVTSAKRQGKNS